jgi:hypothetical protein
MLVGPATGESSTICTSRTARAHSRNRDLAQLSSTFAIATSIQRARATATTIGSAPRLFDALDARRADGCELDNLHLAQRSSAFSQSRSRRDARVGGACVLEEVDVVWRVRLMPPRHLG